MSTDVDDDIRADFLTEAGELVRRLGGQLIDLESRPNDRAVLNDIFRAFHTVKRGAAFVELPPLFELCGAAEDVFSKLRAGKRTVDAELMGAMLQALDCVQSMLDSLAANAALAPAPVELLDTLDRLAQVPALPPPASATPDAQAPDGRAAETETAADAEMPAAIAAPEVGDAAEPAVHPVSDADRGVPAQTPDTTRDEPAGDVAGADAAVPPGPDQGAPEHASKSAVAVEASGDAPVPASDTISEDEFENLLDELHGKGKGPSAAPAEPAAAASSDTISEDEFENLLDELHGKGKGPSAAPAEPAAAASSDTISEDEFENLLDELHGKGKGPGAAAPTAAPEQPAPVAAGPEPAVPPPAAAAPAAVAQEPPVRVSADVDPDIKQDFLTEAGELVQKLGGQLIDLESRPDDTALLNDIFRAFHTVKGGAGFLGLPPLVNLCHAAEDVFNVLRSGKRAVDPQLMDAVLQSLDHVQVMMDAIAADELVHPAPAELIDALHRMAKGETVAAPAARAKPKSQASDDAPTVAAGAPAGGPPAQRRAASPSATPAPETSVRVDTGRLDKMMNLVGELVLVRNRLKALSGRSGPGEQMRRAVGELDFITRGLQNAVMQVRMQPVRKVFSRFPKIARDVARGLGKQVEVELVGEDTDLDKNLVEALADPLVHMVRNSVDHGIEMPDERVRRGKKAAGKLVLSAEQQGDNILICVRDDGGGIDAERVRAKAVEKGVLSADEAAQLTPEESLQLVFQPGFSTKEEVSDLSGRGVGMDVVMSRIKSLGGNVRMDSKLGQGSTVYIRVPLTLAILSALMVTADGREFALPLAGVLDIFELDPDRLDKLDRWDVVLTRHDTLRLVYLDPWLHRGDERGLRHVVVAQVGEERYGFVVQEVRGREEIVIKPLGASLRGLAGISGATVQPDGRVALILDFNGLVETYRRTLARPRVEVAHG